MVSDVRINSREEGVLSPKEPKERLSKQESVVELKEKGSDADLHLFWE